MSGTHTLRIYVSSLSDYNAGRLHGDWLDVTDPDTMNAEIARILRGSKHPNVMVACPDCNQEGETCKTCGGKGEVPSAEEWAVHDWDGGIDLGEHPDIEQLCCLAEAIEEHG